MHYIDGTKLYLAAPYSWKERLQEYALLFEAYGFEVCARWLKQTSNFTTKDNQTVKMDPVKLGEIFEQYSQRDLVDVASCDTLIMFDPGQAMTRKTHLAEFGFALALGKRCIIIGPDGIENEGAIFERLQTVPPELRERGIKPVARYDSWQQLCACELYG